MNNPCLFADFSAEIINRQIPSAFFYLAVMLVVVIVWFLVVKRPIYEAVFLCFIILVALTDSWDKLGVFVMKGLSSSLLYSMIAFMALSVLLTNTKIIDSCVAIILSVLGRITGGAGYVAVVASAFMGALSGSGPGNIMATGTITIPAMKKSGIPAELAANIESNASCLGNMIPPSANIVAAYGAFLALYPDTDLTQGKLWIVLWGASLWFILQRLLMVFAFCRYYHVSPLKKEELPSFKEALKKGWRGLLLPVIILLPFLLDNFLKDSFFTKRLGETGAGYFSSSLLIFTAGVASVFGIVLTKKRISFHTITKWFSGSVKKIVPTLAVSMFGYMIGAVFGSMNVADEMQLFMLNIHVGKFFLVLIVCLLCLLLGMVIIGSTLVILFGSVLITLLASVGVNPILATAMLPCICSVMCGITPPLGLGMYAGMTLAESDFGKTVRNNLWWVAAQFVLEVIVLMGWLPIMGL